MIRWIAKKVIREPKLENENDKTEIIRNLGEIGVFQIYFCGDVGFWVKNGCWYVNLRILGNMGKKKASKNDEK